MTQPSLPRRPDGQPLRVLVTGAGGPAAIGALAALADQAECFAADIDPAAAGLYLVPHDRALLIPRGDHPDLVDHLLGACADYSIDVLIPTVDEELIPIATHLDRFGSVGTHVLVAPLLALCLALDKALLLQALEDTVPTPDFTLLTPTTALSDVPVPPSLAARPGPHWLAKPRSGAGSRGITPVCSPSDLDPLPTDGSYLLSSYLPGPEYSVDVLVSQSGRVVASVPRIRQKLDSGVAVATRVIHHPGLSALAGSAATTIGLTGVANIQFKEDAEGTPHLLEINPRLSGSLEAAALAGAPLIPWAIADLFDQPLPEALHYRPTQVVRYLTEIAVPLTDYDSLSASAPASPNPAPCTPPADSAPADRLPAAPDPAVPASEHRPEPTPTPREHPGRAVVRIDLREDLHAHTTWSDGADTPRALVSAAEARGLQRLAITDHVRASTDWLEHYVAELSALAHETPLDLVIGVEAKILDTAGTLDLPALPPEITQINIADHQFPSPDGPLHPRQVADLLAAGTLSVEQALGWLTTATARAIASCPRPAVVAHLFSILPKCGIAMDAVSYPHLEAIAAACLAHGARIEVSEKWATPGFAHIGFFAARRVHLGASSDAHRADAVGQYRFVARAATRIEGPAAPLTISPSRLDDAAAPLLIGH